MCKSSALKDVVRADCNRHITPFGEARKNQEERSKEEPGRIEEHQEWRI
jgi:hypothetical protein